MYQIFVIFPVLVILFALVKPKCTLTENPFTGPKFSWGLCVAYSAMITIIIGVAWYYAAQLSKPVDDENIPKTSKDIASELVSQPIPAQASTDPSLNRLAIKPFTV